MADINILDEVVLLVDKPEDGLRRGDVGTVIEVGWSDQLQIRDYVIEFIDEMSGRFCGQVYVTDPHDILALRLRRQKS